MDIKNDDRSSPVKNNIQFGSTESDTVCDSSFSFNELIKDVGRQSLKAIKWFVLVLLAFGLPNIIFLIISLFKYGNKAMNESSFCLFIILFIGLTSTAFALYCTYKYILVDTLNIGYKYLTPLFKKICVKIIEKIISGGNRLMGKRDVEKMLNVGSLMIEVYGKKLPNYLQKSVKFILRRIPFSDFLFNMQDDLKSGRKDSKTLSEMLYIQLDTYIKNVFFKNNSMKWITWFLPLNIIIQIILLIYIK